MLSHRPDVVQQPSALSPHRVDAAGKLARAGLGFPGDLPGLLTSTPEQPVGLAPSLRLQSLALVRRRLAQLRDLAHRRVPQLGRLALGRFARLLGRVPGGSQRLLRLALCLLKPVVGLRARAGRNLVGGLVSALENVAGLLADLVERVPDRGFRRRGHLQLRDYAADALDVTIDRCTLVSAQRDWEVTLTRLLEHAIPLCRTQDPAPTSAR